MSLQRESQNIKVYRSYPQPYEAQRVAETGPLLLQDFHLARNPTLIVSSSWTNILYFLD